MAATCEKDPIGIEGHQRHRSTSHLGSLCQNLRSLHVFFVRLSLLTMIHQLPFLWGLATLYDTVQSVPMTLLCSLHIGSLKPVEYYEMKQSTWTADAQASLCYSRLYTFTLRTRSAGHVEYVEGWAQDCSNFKNIDLWVLVEPPHRDGSKKYLQSMFLSRNMKKKNRIYFLKIFLFWLWKFQYIWIGVFL